MKDNSLLYEKTLVEDGLNQVKHLRDQWNYSPTFPIAGKYTDLTSVYGEDAEQYNFIIDEARNSTLETIIKSVRSLLVAYGIDVIPVPLNASYSRCPNAFIHDKTLYIFRKFGIKNRYSEEGIQKLKLKLGVTEYKYIIPMEGDAFAEVINHNDNKDDPSRGTHSYTLEYFFSEFFPEGEYKVFKEYYKKYVDAVKTYFGISIVKSLQPNTLFSFKSFARNNIGSFDYSASLKKICANPYLSYTQKQEIEEQFFRQRYSDLLIGKLPFATCFMTAEWLYNSFREVGGAIDYTSVSMGYFKAIEQFLYDFIGFHTTEKDGKQRTIQFERDGKSILFTDKIYNDEKKIFTLGTMASFLKDPKQSDLLKASINRYTKRIIDKLLSRVSGSRNGFFHKDNIDEFEKVRQDRKLTYLLFYLILGAYKFDSDAYAYFGFAPPLEQDESEKLFEYFHKKSFAGESLEIPVFYFGEKLDIKEFCIPDHDNFVEYDRYGDPKYSGIYYHQLNEMPSKTHKIERGSIPEVVYEGRLIISRQSPSIEAITGPENIIFKNGVFLIK